MRSCVSLLSSCFSANESLSFLVILLFCSIADLAFAKASSRLASRRILTRPESLSSLSLDSLSPNTLLLLLLLLSPSEPEWQPLSRSSLKL